MYFPTTPFSYEIEITFACRNHCCGCANVWTNHRHETLHNWRALFDIIAPPGNRKKYAELIRITGGEPTLHPEFGKIIAYIDTFDIPHATFTSARWENPAEVIDVFKNCRNLIGLLVSLHGSSAFAHNAFVNSEKTAFEETCENIQKATKAGIEVFTNTVLTKYSCEQIEDIIALSQKLGAGYAVFNRFLGAENPIEPSEEQFRKAVILIEQLASEGVPCRIGNCVPQCFVRNSTEGSNAGIEHCAISPKGLVRPDNLTSYVFGNIFEQSIEEIWGAEKAEWFRNQIPEDCLKCLELNRCRGGNRSVTIEHDFEKDRLMKEPITNAEPETIELDPSWKPVPFFNIREEKFGYLLARYNWSIPVTKEAKLIIDSINGENTLLDIQEEFGIGAIELIGHLYKEDFVGFK